MAANGDAAPETPLRAAGSTYDSYGEPPSPYTRAAVALVPLPQPPYAAGAPRPPAAAAVTTSAGAPPPAAAAPAPYAAAAAAAVHADDDPDGYGGTVPAAAAASIGTVLTLGEPYVHDAARRTDFDAMLDMEGGDDAEAMGLPTMAMPTPVAPRAPLAAVSPADANGRMNGPPTAAAVTPKPAQTAAPVNGGVA